MELAASTPWWVIWVPFSIYYVASIPQIITNYRLSSAEGLSYRMVFIDYTGAMSTTIYTFLLCLPLACQVMEPLTMFNIGIMAFQGFYYSRQKAVKRNILLGYGLLHAFGFLMLFLGFSKGSIMMSMPKLSFKTLSVSYLDAPLRELIGHSIGWFSFLVQCFTQLPQVLKNRRRKSVDGLNFLYMTCLGIAGLMELSIAHIMSLPKQTFFNGLRGVGYYIIICYQFWQYRWSKRTFKLPR